jgi:hypothetical protein
MMLVLEWSLVQAHFGSNKNLRVELDLFILYIMHMLDCGEMRIQQLFHHNLTIHDMKKKFFYTSLNINHLQPTFFLKIVCLSHISDF